MEPPNAIPISTLNDYLFCPRRCAIHRLENLWTDNAHTIYGTLSHTAADDAGYRKLVETDGSTVRIERAIPVFSHALNLTGRADIIKFHIRPGNAVELSDPARRRLLAAFYERKSERREHPFLNQTSPIGRFPFIQARLLARHIRGDLDDYVPVLFK